MTISLEHVTGYCEYIASGKQTIGFGLNNIRIRNITRPMGEGE